MASGNRKSIEVEILSYNVLAPPYCRATEFFKCNPKHVRGDNRLKLVKKTLEKFIGRGAVICLQEVTEDWAANLHAFFDERKYNLITSNYNTRSQSGHMGVATAYPRKYELKSCKYLRPSRVYYGYKTSPTVDSAQYANKRRNLGLVTVLAAVGTLTFAGAKMRPLLKSPSWCFAANLVRTLAAVGAGALSYSLASADPPMRERTLEETLRWIANVLILVELYCPIQKRRFWVANYHMPCRFDQPELMTALAALAKNKIFKTVKKNPTLFAGDFNMQPDSPPYRTMVDSKGPSEHRNLSVCGKELFPLKSQPFHSAYKERLGSEPEFTNFAVRKFRGKEINFMGCIDYIFFTNHWEVRKVGSLPNKDKTLENVASYPSKDQPSDHLPISATFTLS